MTIEDVDWILRFPSDELVMSAETLAQVQAAIAATALLAEGVKYRNSIDPENGRMTKVPDKLADRALTIQPCSLGLVSIRVKGKQKAAVYFPVA